METPKIKSFKEVEYDNWLAKAKHCPLKLTIFKCLLHGIDHCSMELCPLHYWMSE